MNNNKDNILLFHAKTIALVMCIVFAIVAALTYLNILNHGGLFADIFNGYLLIAEVCISLISFSAFLLLYAFGKVKNKLTTKANSRQVECIIGFAKKRNEILTYIESASCVEELDKLNDTVNKFNDDADDFYKKYGITPKKITFADFEAKRERFLQTKGK